MKRVALALVLSACGSMVPSTPDSGFIPLGGGGGTGTTTGGGTGTTGGGLAPLTWSPVELSGTSSSSQIVALSGEPGNLWAAQEGGVLFHSSGAAFTQQFRFDSGGARALYASGNVVIVLQTRAIRTCTSNCTQLSDFDQIDLLNSAASWNLTGEAVCGQGTSRLVVIVSNTDSQAQVLERIGTTWTRTTGNIGLRYPRHCWFDERGRLLIVGDDGVLIEDDGGFVLSRISEDAKSFAAGVSFGSTNWVAGQSGRVASGSTSFTLIPSGGDSFLWAAGGLRADEIFFFGYWSYTNDIGNGFKWDGTRLVSVGNLLPGFERNSLVRVIHRVGDSELYVAGTNSDGPAIVKGRR